ncbi:hypothetical protein GCM10027047_01720 [Rhodococcus aerolatus]
MSRVDAGVYGVWLEGHDGQVWDLLNGTEGLWLKDGAPGLRMPDFSVLGEDLADGSGSTWDGIAFSAFDVEHTLVVGDPNHVRERRVGRDWQILDRDVANSIGNPKLPVRYLVVSSSGGWRWLWCHLAAGRKPLGEREPQDRGQQQYRIVHSAASPFYEGFQVAVPVPVPTAVGATSSVVVRNSGPLEADLSWDLVGPCAVSVGVGDQLARLPQLAVGQTATWDTADHTMLDGTGASLRSRIQRDAPRPRLPGRSDSTLVVRRDAAGGGGSVTARWRPRFYEPSA